MVGKQFRSGCGGKGANQAVAAAKLGAEVALIARVRGGGGLLVAKVKEVRGIVHS